MMVFINRRVLDYKGDKKDTSLGEEYAINNTSGRNGQEIEGTDTE